ncbi:MAG: hypothetical protein Q7U53_08070 [Anaerolineaceae bacterium]|nr:hypothetical protein [Anaerolineaceae bacterium]
MTMKFLLSALRYLMMVALLTGCAKSANSLSQVVLPEPKMEEEMVVGELITTGKNEMVIWKMDGEDVKLKITNKSIYWDNNAWMADLPISTGDTITAYGAWDASQTNFLVDRYYSNLLNLNGIVEYVSGESESFQLVGEFKEYFIFPLLYRSEIIYERNENEPDNYYDLLPSPGDYVEVIGREIKGSDVLAVKITHKNKPYISPVNEK